MFKNSLLFIIALTVSIIAQDQKIDTGKIKEIQSKYHEKVLESVTGEKQESIRTKFKANLENFELPTTTSEFNTIWHTPPVCQGSSGMCWSFATTSFLESEVKRLHDKEVKLSELFTVYWEYIEKAKRYIETGGKSRFAEGSLSGAVIKIWQKYGSMPLEAFDGKKDEFYYHDKLFSALNKYMKKCVKSNMKNFDEVLPGLKSILDKHIGAPPAEFEYNGKNYTAKNFLTDYLQINPDDYTIILSFKNKPFYEYTTFDVPDSWWQGKDYFNVPLDDYMKYFKKAVNNGYTMTIDMDFTETGYDFDKDVAVIPSYDIPSKYINGDARYFRFENKTTTDDHLVHLVGVKNTDKGNWYLVKDSWSWAFDGSNRGYIFLHEDFVKLKVLFYAVHKDVVKELFKK